MSHYNLDYKIILSDSEVQREILKQLVFISTMLADAFDTDITAEQAMLDAGYEEG